MCILLADDRAQVRSALRFLLDQEPGMDVVVEADGVQNLLAQATATQPNIVLLDWELPGLPSADLLLALRECCPRVRIVALSGRPEARRDALIAGSDAFVSKGDPPEYLLTVLHSFSEVQVNS